MAEGVRASIFCPGPSLARYSGQDGYQHTIGVNRAVLALPCQWWVFADWQTYLENRDNIKRCSLCTSRGALREIERRVGKPTMPVQLMDDMPEGDNAWRLYSKTVAMVLGYRLGAGIIDVYGDDMAGVTDYDGITNVRNTRTPERWQRERETTQNTIHYLGLKGCIVSRIQL